jgi:hypothetical protein
VPLHAGGTSGEMPKTEGSMELKRGTRVTYRYAGGKIVPGVIVKQHKDLSNWYVVRLTDEAGTSTGSCHRDQITVTDNRFEILAREASRTTRLMGAFKDRF